MERRCGAGLKRNLLEVVEEGLDEGRWVDRPRPTELPTILSNCFTLQATANSNFEGLEVLPRRHGYNSSRCLPPRAPATLAMNAPINIEKNKKNEPCAVAFRVWSATSRTFVSAAWT
jgi:hypothetical protein